jgi:4'-phosphopantetheinyl transferase
MRYIHPVQTGGSATANTDDGTLGLWFAYPDDLLDDTVAQTCVGLLSTEEVQRWKAFKFDRHRCEYLATRTLARTALSHYADHLPQAWRFHANEFGKPAVDPPCGLRFNLSNSLELVACLIGHRGDVGVDIEPRRRAESIVEIAPRMFSPLELAQLHELREDQRPERCLRLWTLKEAYIKARGMGLALPLDKFSFEFDEAGSIRLLLDRSLKDRPERWRFCLLEHAGHYVALMVECGAPVKLRRWELRQPASAAELVREETWF